MSRKSKIDPVEKVKIVERYLNGKISIQQAGKIANIAYQSVQKWVRIYKAEGPTGLLNQTKNRRYSKTLKMNAVNDYLSGKGSLGYICQKYRIRSNKQLCDWIRVYNSGGTLKESTGGTYMTKARTTTPKERLQIVKDCLMNDNNYGAMAIKYNCSYQQIRNWVKKYKDMGSAGLEDRRGRRVGSQPSPIPEEELRDKIAELERMNTNLQMENDLLKKVRELERRDHYF
jgi:transposase-like protein